MSTRRREHASLRFTSPHLENWRNFWSVDVDLSRRVFVVGPNASGRSNLLDVFRFLHDVVSVGGGLEEAVRKRQGISKLRALAARQVPDIVIGVVLGDANGGTTWWRARRRVLRAVALLLLVMLATRSVSAQWLASSRPPDDTILQNFSAEFPPNSIGPGHGYPHRDVMAAHAEQLLREAPDALDTLVRELESGAYPSSDWVARAPWLAFEARLGDPAFAPGNAERLLAAYLEFARDHFTLPATGYFAERLRWLFTEPVFDLFEWQGDGVAGVERALEDLERIDAPRAQFMRGAFYVERLARGPEDARPAMLQKARDTLSALASAPGGGLHARRALATLASLDYTEGDFAAARAGFEAYLTAYPDTDWSWVAAMGIGAACPSRRTTASGVSRMSPREGCADQC